MASRKQARSYLAGPAAAGFAVLLAGRLRIASTSSPVGLLWLQLPRGQPRFAGYALNP